MTDQPFNSFDRLIDAIYAAPGDDAGWASAIGPLESAFRGRVALFEQSAMGASALAKCSESGAAAVDDYLERLWPADLAMRALRQLPVGAIVADSDLDTGTEKSSAAREFYDGYLDRINGQRGVYVAVHDGGDTSFVLSVRRGRSEGDFTAPEKARLALLTPHFDRSIRSWAKMRQRSMLSSAALNVVADCGFGFVLLDRDLKVHHCAPTCLAHRGDQIVVVSDGERVRLTDATRSVGLRAMVHLALSGGESAPQTALVHGPAGSSVPIMVRPFRPYSGDVALGALAIVSFPLVRQQPSVALLQAEYQFTRAEVRLVESLVAGKSLSEYAEQAGLQRSTVKSHLDSVFSKTGDRRQADLIRRVLGLRTAN